MKDILEQIDSLIERGQQPAFGEQGLRRAYVKACDAIRRRVKASRRSQDGPPTEEQLAKWGTWWVEVRLFSHPKEQEIVTSAQVGEFLRDLIAFTILRSRPVDEDGLPCWHKLEGGAK